MKRKGASVRRAAKAGSWYSEEEALLRSELDSWLAAANTSSSPNLKALIAPHAGYSYSGPTAAYAYKGIDPSKVKRIFLLGPSHYLSSDTCLLSRMDEYETPLGNIKLDRLVIDELAKAKEFDVLDQEDEEQEHSLELHLPYIYRMMEGQDFLLVPIMVGHMDNKALSTFGKILSKYFEQPETLFIISTDFCHWGSSCGEIWQSIEELDSKGMKAIETLSTENFLSYLKQYKNTICGRHCVALLLETIAQSSVKAGVRFVHYAQSSRCKKKNDSSVSYVSGLIEEKQSEKS
eukprot:TRINITY_DN438_c0_g1_i4.p1 TRINITY_DN438_c0_g1~~TRINITY_DN438_c0_g1_i4.p1  ORF type:complete len:291 (+),score=42.16 TRINITY_DN438_c0_g1_i4:81-953(+)